MKGNLDNTVVTAGDVADSYLHEVLTLDEDDDMFMPPKGGPLTAEQIDIIKRWIEEGAKPKAGGGGTADTGDGISFNDHIFPILEERCLDCHGEPYVKNGRTIHPKAGLALNTYELVLKGNLDGPIIERGNHEESTLYVVMTLDPDDSEIMPPKGDPYRKKRSTFSSNGLTKEQKSTLQMFSSCLKKRPHWLLLAIHQILKFRLWISLIKD